MAKKYKKAKISDFTPTVVTVRDEEGKIDAMWISRSLSSMRYEIAGYIENYDVETADDIHEMEFDNVKELISTIDGYEFQLGLEFSYTPLEFNFQGDKENILVHERSKKVFTDEMEVMKRKGITMSDLKKKNVIGDDVKNINPDQMLTYKEILEAISIFLSNENKEGEDK